MYQFVFVDLDDTIFDFETSEKASFIQLGADLGLEVTPEIYQAFHGYNKELWARIEQGDLSKAQLLAQRFPDFFQGYGIELEDGKATDDRYRAHLVTHTHLKAGAKAFLEDLKAAGKELFAASNGVFQTQIKRLHATGTMEYFDRLFISERVGYEKPSPKFFYQIFDRIEGFDKAKAIMVGDRLSSDIKGASDAGLATCWLNENYEENPDGIPVTFESDSLAKIKAFILK